MNMIKYFAGAGKKMDKNNNDEDKQMISEEAGYANNMKSE